MAYSMCVGSSKIAVYQEKVREYGMYLVNEAVCLSLSSVYDRILKNYALMTLMECLPATEKEREKGGKF